MLPCESECFSAMKCAKISMRRKKNRKEKRKERKNNGKKE